MKVINGKKPIKMWTDKVPVCPKAEQQLLETAEMPFIHKHLAVMPDVHLGKGATVGSVIPTHKAIIPAAVGVDIGCGMMAVKLSLKADILPDNLHQLRCDIEAAIPVGFKDHGDVIPQRAIQMYTLLDDRLKAIYEKHPKIMSRNKSRDLAQLGTLGGGNHFVEICIDKEDNHLWVMLHSGSRGVGNRIGSYFIEKAKELMEQFHIETPNKDLAYIPEGHPYFDDYVEAMQWAQDYAKYNREVMMGNTLDVVRKHFGEFTITSEAINCHHNYVSKEHHFGENVWVTRKGAVRARKGELGIIPGSMGAKSFIVEGLGNAESFCSCSHGAGRVMSRTQAKKEANLEEHAKATEGVECRKDEGVLDETPKAYKNIDDVMASQEDLVVIRHEIKQILCVKG